MKLMTDIFRFVIVLTAICVFAPPVYAQETKMAVVDVQKLLSESKAAQNLQEQLNVEREKSQTEFSRHEQELKATEQKLVAERNSMSAEEFEKKRDAFEQKLLEIRRLVQKRKRELDEAFNQALNRLRDEIIKASAEVSREEGYNIVLSKQYIVVLDKDIDITDKVLVKLDKNLPNLLMKVKSN
jgi:Skp family chaperone for outer membrane proteins